MLDCTWMRKRIDSGLLCFPYVGILLQELSLNLDDHLVSKLATFLSHVQGAAALNDVPSMSDVDEDCFLKLYYDEYGIHSAMPPKWIHKVGVMDGERDMRMWIELLMLNPIKMNLTFNRCEVKQVGDG